MKQVAIIDYGVGNLFSVSRAFEQFNCKVDLVSGPETLASYDFLVLPGVGAFSEGMGLLKAANLDRAVVDLANKGKPLLGICLGMQMLMDRSFEFGETRGLGLIEGDVVPIPDTDKDGRPHKVPHVGWAQLVRPCEKSGEGFEENSILRNSRPGVECYFVHSFMADPKNYDNRLADVDYNGKFLTAAIQKGNIAGCQFHPEKSGAVGLGIIKSFLNL